MLQKSLKELPQNDPEKWTFENNLAIAFLRRHGVSGNTDDLEAAITLNESTLRSAPETHGSLGNFYATRCNALRLLYKQTHSEKHLNDAIVEGAKAISGRFFSPCLE